MDAFDPTFLKWDSIQKLKYRAKAGISAAERELNYRLEDRLELPLPGIRGETLYLTGYGALRKRADDLIIMVGSRQAAERVIKSISRYIEEKLGLKVNASKSKIDKPKGIKYLGFGFYYDSFAKEYRAKPHTKAVEKFKARMKELTCRSWGVDNAYKVKKLNELIRGWINYFKIGSMKSLCEKLDANIRYRLRMCIWKHWKTPQSRAKNLIKLGISRKYAWSTAYSGARIAYVCQRGAMNIAVTKERLTRFGLVSMVDYYAERRVPC